MADRRLRAVSLVLSVFGIGITTYLTYIHYAGIDPVCNIAQGCEVVLTSKYSKLLGVPLSLLGLIGYVGVLVSLIVDAERGRIGASFFTMIGFGLSAYLFYREVVTLDAFCQWCLASGVVLVVLLVTTTWRLIRDPSLHEA